MPLQVRKAVIPAAGLGTRFLPATKVIPKELLPIVDKPAIQYIVEEAIAAGLDEIIFVISKDKEKVVEHFRPCPEMEDWLRAKRDNTNLERIISLQGKASFRTVYQDKPLGLGHAVLRTREAVGDEWFFVFLPDDLIFHEVPCSLQMIRSWQGAEQEGHQGATVAVMEVPWDEVSHYGVVKALPITARLGKIESVVEKPKREEAPSNLAIIGRYLLPPRIFSLLEKVRPGAGGEIQLTDALLDLVGDEAVYAFQFEGERFDVGSKIGFLEANIHYGLNHPELGPKVIELMKLFAESR